MMARAIGIAACCAVIFGLMGWDFWAGLLVATWAVIFVEVRNQQKRARR